ncbi:molybdopterin cofactor-binding domain-containing protein [Undibacterium sp. SXout11W]|uniref:xanthine dehydrogenase family protein molybdopterin-binding subunit n=1 Tax=Undibacterium sp. SXout11W TaxID=3413050 RepID=UPI003BF0EB76
MNAPSMPSRRLFIGSSVVAGAWILGVSNISASNDAQAQELKVEPVKSPFDFWLKFTASDEVIAYTTVTSLGQGTFTSIAQIVAEELTLSMEKIHVEHAPVIAEFHQNRGGVPPGITTFGSRGFIAARITIGSACAAARDMLLLAAAQLWQVPLEECILQSGTVYHQSTRRLLAFSQLFDIAATLPVPQKPKVKEPKDWQVLGKSTPRADIPSRVNGSAIFGIDVMPQGLLYAAVIHAPRFGESLVGVDQRPALKLKGVHKVVVLFSAVAVVADSYWTATVALKLLKPVWRASNKPVLDSEQMSAALLDAVTKGDGLPFPSARRQNVDGTAAALTKAAHIIDTTFEAPFLAHATMEPMNATIEVSRNRAQVWISTQSQSDTQRGIAEALGLKVEQVTLHSQHVGGGFGRRLEQDFAIEAALIAKDIGVPVKTIWSRENDTRAGYYRPMTTARLRLALDEQFMPMALRTDMASPSLLAYSKVTNGPAIKGYDWSTIMGLFGLAYPIPTMDTRWDNIDFGVPCGYWRSVGNSQNTLFIEQTLELAARAAGEDSIAYRRRLLRNHPRALGFINQFAAHAKWDAPLMPNSFRGFAMNGTGEDLYSAHIVEIEVIAPGKFKLSKIFAAIDPGIVANPKMVEAQMQGGTFFGLSAVLFGEISFKDGMVEQGNFDTYRLMQMSKTPTIDVLVMSQGTEIAGVGEEGPPSIIAAVANALLAAGGKPIVRLPVNYSGWELA